MNAHKPIEPGCLAIVVGAHPLNRGPLNIGRLVTVLQRVSPGDSLPDGYYFVPRTSDATGRWWLVEPYSGNPLYFATSDGAWHLGSTAVVSEHHLRRLDDLPGEDETLAIAGYPPSEAQQFRAAMKQAFNDLRTRMGRS